MPQSDRSLSGVPVMSNQTRKSSRRPEFQSKIAIGVLAGWLVSNFSAQAIALDLTLGNSGIKFDRDTALEPSFLESHGAYQSTFGVIDLKTNQKTPLLVEVKPADTPAYVGGPSTHLNDRDTQSDFAGIPGNAVPRPISKYVFRANNDYVFYLESTLNGRPAGIVYSTDTLNPSQERQVVFAGRPTDLCTPDGMILAWDDTGSKLVKNRQQQDRDFDDYVVRLRSSACEPKVSESPGVGGGATSGGAMGGGSSGGGGGLMGLGSIAGLGLTLALLRSGGDNDSELLTKKLGTLPVEQIPTPSTFFGSTMALGLAALRRRRQEKRLKKK